MANDTPDQVSPQPTEPTPAPPPPPPSLPTPRSEPLPLDSSIPQRPNIIDILEKTDIPGGLRKDWVE